MHWVPEWHNDPMNLSQVSVFILFFIAGLLVSRYKQLADLVVSQWGFTISLILFWVIFLASEARIPFVCSTICSYVKSLTAIIWVTYYFKKLEDNKDSIAGRNIGTLLASIGRKTLDIYVLHYFILSWLPLQKYTDVILGNGFMFELLVCIVLALLMAMCSLIISAILRTSNFLSFFFLGDWSKRLVIFHNNHEE
jgi:hypothetical protein